jgi:IS66 Orf2 like protein
VDFRKGHDGLAALVQQMFGLDPFSGAAFVFRAKRAQLVSLCIPLSDSRQADHLIILIIIKDFRTAFDYAPHR